MPRISARPVIAVVAAILMVACLGAAAQASSIVYVKDNAVWVTSPDGKHQ